MVKNMRLIDADELITFLEDVTITDGITFETGFKQVIADIKDQPTAFDMDKVLNELKHEESEALRRYNQSKGTAYEFSDKCSWGNWVKAIDIVKRGRRYEK